MTGPDPAADRPGLQAARTRLAWRRSMLGVLVGGLLALRGGPVVGRWPAAVVALAAVALGTLF